jgi:ABC-type branched-subunit amino acid transport system permease subunit
MTTLGATRRAMGDRLREDRTTQLTVIAVATAVAALLPWGLNSFWQNLLVDALLAVLLALGLNVVVGFAGLLDLGYVAFYAIGHYAYAIPTASAFSKAIILNQGQGEVPPFPVWHNWMWLLFFVAIAAAMITGVILGGPTLRLRGDYLAIVTLGFGEIVRLAAINFDTITLGSRGITQVPHPGLNVGTKDLTFGLNWPGYYYLLLLMTLVMLFVIVQLNNSRIGRAWHAIREDEVAAQAMGVPTVRMKLWAFAIGASTAGIAGAVQASRINFVSPDDFTLLLSIFVLSMVVLGGMGSLVGSIVGATAITIIPEFLRTQFAGFQEFRFLIFGAILVIMMIFRPQGIVPSRRRAIELTGGVTMPGQATIDQPQEGVGDPSGAGHAPQGSRDGGDDASA